MTNEEFSNSLDTLLNSYNIQAGFGEGSNKQGGIALNEYEKSVLLTQAQDIIVKSYFDKTLNQQGQGFDDSTRRQVDFSSLIKNATYKNSDVYQDSDILIHTDNCYDDRGLAVNLDADKRILFILNEKLEVEDNEGNKKTYIVVPINYREYDREMSKAYGQPLKKQAWRLFSNMSTGYDIQSEIIPIYGSINTLPYYYVRYNVHGGEPKTFTWDRYILKKGEQTTDIYNNISEVQQLPNPNVGTIAKINENSNPILIYKIRYVQRPTPIVLRDLPDGLSVDGETEETSCSLNPILHIDILNKAFELAITTRGGGTAQRQQDNNQRQ